MNSSPEAGLLAGSETSRPPIDLLDVFRCRHSLNKRPTQALRETQRAEDASGEQG